MKPVSASMLVFFMLAAASSTVNHAAENADFPNKPIRIIVPFPPGGGTGTMARAISGPLAEALGQQVVVDNRGGGGANIGAEIAAKSPPDGYTWFLMTGTHTVNATLYRNLGYNLLNDFVPVSHLGGTAYVVVVHPSVPVKSVKELIALAKQDVKSRLDATGMVPELSSPEELRSKTVAEVAKWAKVVKALNLTVN